MKNTLKFRPSDPIYKNPLVRISRHFSVHLGVAPEFLAKLHKSIVQKHAENIQKYTVIHVDTTAAAPAFFQGKDRLLCKSLHKIQITTSAHRKQTLENLFPWKSVRNETDTELSAVLAHAVEHDLHLRLHHTLQQQGPAA